MHRQRGPWDEAGKCGGLPVIDISGGQMFLLIVFWVSFGWLACRTFYEQEK